MQSEHIKKIFIDLYYANACNISESCKTAGISRTTYYNWLQDDLQFKEAIEDAHASLVDLAESQLLKNIKAGKEASLIFFLINRAPHRWVDKRTAANIINANIQTDPKSKLAEEDKIPRQCIIFADLKEKETFWAFYGHQL